VLLLDSGGVSRLARRNQDAAATITVFRREGLWPPVVPSMVLLESLTGRQRTDAALNRFLKTCDVEEEVPERIARRAAALRAQAGRGSPVDALIVAIAEPGGTVLSGDIGDLRALATYAADVVIRRA
jgi:predicted nucleic acid-binding protein